ncbi:UDP-N-acetylmuramoyl-L-alanyl-D-glutamate--2,6-diaminopimelate ligase [Robertmurraya sp. GLU-23]
MILQDVIKGIQVKNNPNISDKDIFITGIADNSKEVKSGYIFVAVSGYSSDGHDYIEHAVSFGASIVIGEKEIDNLQIPYLQVNNSRRALGIIAKNFYNDPSSKKIMIGITGTNGKTTTSFMLQQILEKNGITCSVIGTINNIINGKKLISENTTPGSIKLNSLLHSSKDQVVIMEVSSHGLAQYRLEGIKFDYCIFTNLYHEHLDFHGSMDEYFLAKSLLFEKLKPCGFAIINGDNHWGMKLYKILQEREITTYLVGTSNSNDLIITTYESAKNPFILLTEEDQSVAIKLPIPGLHNLYNAALAYSTARCMSIQKESILSALNSFPGVPGRFEIYRHDLGPTFVVDYAHTADAFEFILQTVKKCGAKRIIHIFGFRGGRDLTKRAEMVEVSSKISDYYILTIDDLNNEKVNEMFHMMENLTSKNSPEKGLIILDRTLAIQTAQQMGKTGDWIVITGKGPEQYKQPFVLPTNTDKETVLYVQGQLEKELRRNLSFNQQQV